MNAPHDGAPTTAAERNIVTTMIDGDLVGIPVTPVIACNF
jgi:hypothetical protein